MGFSPFDVQLHAPQTEECKLLSGGFATYLQIVLGMIALSVLVLKRYREIPQRPIVVWSFDASKQLVGAGFAHMLNLLIAILLYRHQEIEIIQHVDQCALYFVNFSMDTTIGVLLNWALLSCTTWLAIRFRWKTLMNPGDYGSPIQLRIWLHQLLAWVIVIAATKVCIGITIYIFERPLGAFAMWIFTPLQPFPRVELVIVMIACPCLMNAAQFWIQDSFLKKAVGAPKDIVKDGRLDCVKTKDIDSPDVVVKKEAQKNIKQTRMNNSV